MKCITCDSEINPKFKHAIEKNVCPFLWWIILWKNYSRAYLLSLQDTMQKMQEYPEQLNDWLLSNYSYIKTDSPDLKNYVPKEALKDMKKELDNEDFVERKKKVIKVKVEGGKEVMAITEKIQSDAKTAGFFQRAQDIIKRDDDGGADIGDEGDADTDFSDETDEGEDVQLNPIQSLKKPRTFKNAAEKTRHFKELKKKIEEEGAQVVIGETGLASMIDSENLENADPELVAALRSELGDGDIITSAFPQGGLDDEDAMTDRILSINRASASGNKAKNSTYNEADVQALRNQYTNVAKSKKAFEDGENRGKGGFSRT